MKLNLSRASNWEKREIKNNNNKKEHIEQMNIKSSRKEYKWTCRRHQKVGATGRVRNPICDICECDVYIRRSLSYFI